MSGWLESLRFLFDRSDVVVHRQWSPTGDWLADAPAVWDAAWRPESVQSLNDTHSVLETRMYDGNNARTSPYLCTFRTVTQMDKRFEHVYPFLGSPSLDASSFDGTPLSAYMREYYWIPVFAVALYLVLTFGGVRIMQNRKAFDLDRPLFLWNLALSVFSWLGFIRIAPQLLLTISNEGVYHSVCENVCKTFGNGESGFWAWLFIVSKIPELFDTAFIVLRKKPLIFLHWFHHATVLLYCWQSYTSQNSAGIYFIAMNYFVHAVMYGYYALKAIDSWPKWAPSWVITLFQLSQMVLGIAVCISIYVYRHFYGLGCSVSYVSYTSGALMYFSYFLLFLNVLVKLIGRSCRRHPNRQKKVL